jgi:hypothetical protein
MSRFFLNLIFSIYEIEMMLVSLLIQLHEKIYNVFSTVSETDNAMNVSSGVHVKSADYNDNDDARFCTYSILYLFKAKFCETWKHLEMTFKLLKFCRLYKKSSEIHHKHL